MGKQTSIPCESDVRDRLAADKPDDMSWSAFLSKLHSDGEIPVDETPAATGDVDVDVDAIADAVAARNMTLDADERTKIAREVAGELR